VLPSNSSIRPILSGIAALTVLFVTLAVLSLQRLGDTPTSMGVHAYLVEWCQSGRNVNFLCQRDAYVSAIISCVLFIFVGTKFALKFERINTSGSLRIISSAVVIGFCLFNVFWWANQQVSKIGWLVTAIAVCVSCFCNKLIEKRRILSSALLILLALIGLLSVLPGLITTYDASWMPPSLFIEFQQGYSVVATQCDRISMGQQIFVDVKPNYGILLQVLSGLWESYGGILSFGQNIQIIRWLQALSVLFLFVTYCWYARCKPVTMGLSFLMVLPWLHTNQISLIFPNLSPWRTFGFPLAFVGMILCGRLNEKLRFYCLGLLAGICISINLESGICILIGFLSHAFFSSHLPGTLFPAAFLRRASQCFFGTLIFLFALHLFVYAAFGYAPNLQAYLQHLQGLQYVAKTGYLGGFKLEYSPLPVLFFCHYCYVLFLASLSTSSLTERECFRAFAATMALVWSAYYFNRPGEWYFQLQFYFYGILLIDVVRLAQLWRLQWIERRCIALLCLICLIVPQIVLSFQSAQPSFENMLKQWILGKVGRKDAQLISGIFIEPKAALEIRDKAKFLRQESISKEIFYFTGCTVLMPKLTKLYLNARFDDPFMELPYTSDTDRFVNQLKCSPVEEVLIDADDSYLIGDKFRLACWKNIQQKLAPEFVFDGHRSYWKVYTRITKQNRATNKIGVLKAKE